ncbi:MAG: hypothetical protein KKB31_07975 [Nanoarchaeota archaeon]|nr:hypothetical protein [Nanoarchaeota archaeon]
MPRFEVRTKVTTVSEELRSIEAATAQEAVIAVVYDGSGNLLDEHEIDTYAELLEVACTGYD